MATLIRTTFYIRYLSLISTVKFYLSKCVFERNAEIFTEFPQFLYKTNCSYFVTMGARTPTKFKLRRPTYKCDECDKKFLSAQALKSHQYCLHKIKMKPKTKGKLLNLLGKPVKKTSGVQKKDVDVVPEVSDVRKIQYECPQCQLRFSVYFSAFRHIQRSHSAEVKEA